jgi:hypothetical protein
MAYIRTFKNVQDEVLALLDEAGDTSTTLTLVKNAISAAHAKRVTEDAWSFMLWDTAATLSIVVGQQVYTLHPEFFRPLYLYNRTAEQLMTQRDAATFLASGADWINDTGSALEFTLWGKTPVARQPLAASLIAVASSNAADNGAASVILRGDTALGVRTETVTCGSSSSVEFTKILQISKTATAWVGTMTLTSDAGAVTNLNLFHEEYGRSYQQVFLLAVPDATEVAEYRFYRQPNPLVNDNDILDIPSPFEMIAAYDALLALSAYNQYDGNTLSFWREQREDLLLRLRQSMSPQANALGAATPYTNYIAR